MPGCVAVQASSWSFHIARFSEVGRVPLQRSIFRCPVGCSLPISRKDVSTAPSLVPGKTLLLGAVAAFEAQSNSRLNRNLGVPLKNKHELRKQNQRCSITNHFASVLPFPWEIPTFCGQAHYLLCTRVRCFKPGNELCSSFKSSKGRVFLLIFNTFHLHLLMHTLKYTVSLKKTPQLCLLI